MAKCINCNNEGPHFVPPSFGDRGFFMCDSENWDRETNAPNSDTPETTSDSGVKSDEPQNPSNNSVSSTGGDLDDKEF